MFANKQKVRLPQVRRRAGESLRERREQIVDEKLLPLISVVLVLWLVYVTQQLQQWTRSGPQPRLWLCFALVVTLISAIRFWRLLPVAWHFNRGERGERYVADVLEELRTDGYKPIHDIVGDGFNVDHVLVGPGGVFAIETKYRSGKGEITFRNGEGVFIGDRLEEKDCLKQARGNALAIRNLIQENCGRREYVTPVVVFVGDWKIKNKWRDTNTRVFTPERLLDYIRDQQPRLTRKEIELIASHLARSAKD